jgi:hypothetical protein
MGEYENTVDEYDNMMGKNQDYNTMDKHNNIKWTKTRTLHTDDPERRNTRTGAMCRH